MLERARQSASRLLWLGVAYMVADCVAAIKLFGPLDLPAEAEGGSSNLGSGGGGGGPLAVWVDKLSLRFFRFHRGELVVLKSPDQPRRRLLRRLVALEGDFVSVAGGRMERVPKGACWVEADAGLRAPGGDSRVAWGAVPLALIDGRASHVLWPPHRVGALAPQPCPSGTRVVGKAGSLEVLSPPEEDGDWWS